MSLSDGSSLDMAHRAVLTLPGAGDRTTIRHAGQLLHVPPAGRNEYVRQYVAIWQRHNPAGDQLDDLADILGLTPATPPAAATREVSARPMTERTCLCGTVFRVRTSSSRRTCRPICAAEAARRTRQQTAAETAPEVDDAASLDR